MKSFIWLTALFNLLLLMQCTFSTSQTAQKISDDRLVTYRSLHEAPRFQEPLQFAALGYPRLHAAMVHATNVVRVRRGVSPLTAHPLLEKAAWRYAQRMAEKKFLGHIDPYAAAHLRTPEQRARVAGVVNARPAENLATYFGIQYQASERVYSTPGQKGRFSRTRHGQPIPNHTYRSLAEEVVAYWMSSPSHRANVLSKDAVQLGCGAAFFWDAHGFPKFALVQLYQWYEPARP